MNTPQPPSPRSEASGTTVGRIDNPIDITINGDPHTVPAGSSVAALLGSLDTPPKGIAVAVNRAVITRSRWAECTIEAGDRVDIVRAIGGG